MPLAVRSQHWIWQVVVAAKEAYQGDPYHGSISCFMSIITTVCYCVLVLRSWAYAGCIFHFPPAY